MLCKLCLLYLYYNVTYKIKHILSIPGHFTLSWLSLWRLWSVALQEKVTSLLLKDVHITDTLVTLGQSLQKDSLKSCSAFHTRERSLLSDEHLSETIHFSSSRMLCSTVISGSGNCSVKRTHTHTHFKSLFSNKWL